MSNFTITRTDDYLMHHGVKGQKWGIRRYQNPDGSLTQEGKNKYGEQQGWEARQMYKQGTITKEPVKDLNLPSQITIKTKDDSRDGGGYIMSYVIVRDENYLAHHGVKGQKWGVRRYQNEDGSLTAKGQKQREKIEKWYNSNTGKMERSKFKEKGYSEYDAYKTQRNAKAAGIGAWIAGPLGAAIGGFTSHKRVSAGREFFEKEISRLSKGN